MSHHVRKFEYLEYLTYRLDVLRRVLAGIRISDGVDCAFLQIYCVMIRWRSRARSRGIQQRHSRVT